VLIPAFSALLFLIPLVGNFYPTAPEPPFNYFVYILIGWTVAGVVLVILLRRFSPESLEKMGSAFATEKEIEKLISESQPLLYSQTPAPDKDGVSPTGYLPSSSSSSLGYGALTENISIQNS